VLDGWNGVRKNRCPSDAEAMSISQLCCVMSEASDTARPTATTKSAALKEIA
jgi:hypothetical protein